MPAEEPTPEKKGAAMDDMHDLEIVLVLRRDVRFPANAPVINIDVKVWCPSLPPTDDFRAKVLNLRCRGLEYFIRREKQPSSDIVPVYSIHRSKERDWVVFKTLVTALRNECVATLFPYREYMCGLYLNTVIQAEAIGILIYGKKPTSYLKSR